MAEDGITRVFYIFRVFAGNLGLWKPETGSDISKFSAVRDGLTSQRVWHGAVVSSRFQSDGSFLPLVPAARGGGGVGGVGIVSVTEKRHWEPCQNWRLIMNVPCQRHSAAARAFKCFICAELWLSLWGFLERLINDAFRSCQLIDSI